MNDDASPLLSDPQARGEWVHSLRNAMNTAGMGLMLAERLLDKGQAGDAKAMITSSLESWHQCQRLLEQATFATQLPVGFHDANTGDVARSLHRRD